LKRMFLILLMACCIIWITGCSDDDDNPTGGDDSPASITGTLTLPADATGKPVYVLVDDDDDGGTGWLFEYVGLCGPGTSIGYDIDSVDAGTYYLYAVVYAVNDSGDAPGSGDYIGFYGTGASAPAQANAVVPSTGSATFDITLYTISR